MLLRKEYSVNRPFKKKYALVLILMIVAAVMWDGNRRYLSDGQIIYYLEKKIGVEFLSGSIVEINRVDDSKDTQVFEIVLVDERLNSFIAEIKESQEWIPDPQTHFRKGLRWEKIVYLKRQDLMMLFEVRERIGSGSTINVYLWPF